MPVVKLTPPPSDQNESIRQERLKRKKIALHTVSQMRSKSLDYDYTDLLSKYDGAGVTLEDEKMSMSVDIARFDWVIEDEGSVMYALRGSEADYQPLCKTQIYKDFLYDEMSDEEDFSVEAFDETVGEVMNSNIEFTIFLMRNKYYRNVVQGAISGAKVKGFIQAESWDAVKVQQC